jgi:16S rRNA (cytosine967-C5)-methyltransferase
MAEEVDLTKTAAYKRGAIEIQDLGSQLVLASVGIESGGRWLDACAGAGGKTLQLSRLVGSAGRVDAHDVRSAALDELQARARRAGATNITIAASPRDEYDGVLIDAPCSGSGTWRRAPHLKWMTSHEAVEEKAALQRSLLHQFARNVRSGGLLVYATCSLAQTENEAVIAKFLSETTAFEPVAPAQTFGCVRSEHGLTILPSIHDTDGFFVSVMKRR